MSHFYQMRDPMRDQTETLEAIKELSVFLDRFPNEQRSALFPEAQKQLREARDRIGEHELGVGVQYHQTRWYPGAIERFEGAARQGSPVHQARRRAVLPRRLVR